MRDKLFLDAIKKIQQKDDTYPVEAYFFIRSALDTIIKVLDKPATGPGRHERAGTSGRYAIIRVAEVRTYGINGA